MHDQALQQNEMTRLSLTGGAQEPSEVGITASAGIAGGGITGTAGKAVPPQLDASDVLGQVDTIQSAPAQAQAAQTQAAQAAPAAQAATGGVDELTFD